MGLGSGATRRAPGGRGEGGRVRGHTWSGTAPVTPGGQKEQCPRAVQTLAWEEEKVKIWERDLRGLKVILRSFIFCLGET